ncbi:MAG: type II secretion system F family protein [Clostridiales bacterium]|nr:type II secretion system F family protein [Clostridiales bacterium]
MGKKAREPQYIPSALNTPMLNYRVYYMSAAEKLLTFLLAAVVGGGVGLIFYGGQFKDEDGLATTATYIGNIVIFLVVGVIVGSVFLSVRSRKLRDKRKTQITHQFRELLSALAASLSSGMNMQESLESACNDLTLEYSEDAYIVQEVKEMLNGIKNNVPLEETIAFFGERSEIDDIKSFGIVFSMCYRTGGNLKDIVRRTNNIISEKIEISEEIETTISSNKSQFNVMIVFPVVLVLMLRYMSSSFAASFSTVPGIIAITVAIVIFAVAYFTAQSIMDIKG